MLLTPIFCLYTYMFCKSQNINDRFLELNRQWGMHNCLACRDKGGSRMFCSHYTKKRGPGPLTPQSWSLRVPSRSPATLCAQKHWHLTSGFHL